MAKTKPQKKSDECYDYRLPRHNVLLLSCMDLRLIDDLVRFMDRDNLTNRYDHLVFAGAALGVMQTTHFSSWREVFFDHLLISMKLHLPHDIYIVEHRNCGAYREFLGEDLECDPEKDIHTRWARDLRDAINEWWPRHAPQVSDKLPVMPHIHGFLMDLRGEVDCLDLGCEELASESPKKPKRKA